MARDADGEFELVLGNRQLLSVFFILVVLLGLFFTVGYIVGRNTGPAADRRTAQVANSNAIVVEPASELAAFPGSAKSDAAKVNAAKVNDSSAPAKPASQATSSPSSVGAVRPREESPGKPTTPPAEPPKAADNVPAPGAMFLQVAATKKPEAELLIEVLGKKGFRAILSPVPDQALLRVLVGPLADADAVAKGRADLTAIGFKPILRKF